MHHHSNAYSIHSMGVVGAEVVDLVVGEISGGLITKGKYMGRQANVAQYGQPAQHARMHCLHCLHLLLHLLHHSSNHHHHHLHSKGLDLND